MFLPIGLDESRLARRPWVTIAVALACVGAFLATEVAGRSPERETEVAFRDVLGHLKAHPYLEPPVVLQRVLGLGPRDPEQLHRDPPPRGDVAGDQAELERLTDVWVEAWDRTPARRYSLVPARGVAQVGWITHIFMHAGFFHLLGNLLIFVLVAGPFLEDAWGRPFFVGFYLLGGIVAGAAHVARVGPSPVQLLGASGAISACLGAFALRFAHRRVRIAYWFALFFRGTFLVPGWLYALFGLAMDVLGMKLSGTSGGGVAYAAHVGGFLFGLAVAGVVWAGDLERRISPAGAVRWQSSMPLQRAADAVAAGDAAKARGFFAQALEATPDDSDALLGLARLESAAHDHEAARPRVERVLARRLAAGDAAGARELLAEFELALRPGELRPATAYRAAGALEQTAPARAVAFLEATAAAGGALGAKALVRAAGILRAREPERAAELAGRALALEGAPPEVTARAAELVAALQPAPAAAPASRTAGAPPRVVPCQLVGAGSQGLVLATGGRASTLAPDRIEAVAVGLLVRYAEAGTERRNAVVADLVLRVRPGERRVVVRIPGHQMALSRIHPGVPAADAFAAVMRDLLDRSGAEAIPGPVAAVGRPFARFEDLAAFEAACHGGPLGAEQATRAG